MIFINHFYITSDVLDLIYDHIYPLNGLCCVFMKIKCIALT